MAERSATVQVRAFNASFRSMTVIHARQIIAMVVFPYMKMHRTAQHVEMAALVYPGYA